VRRRRRGHAHRPGRGVRLRLLQAGRHVRPRGAGFAEGQAAVAAARIVATIQDRAPSASYDGRGICYLEFGHDEVAKVDVTFLAGQRPTGGMEGPSTELAADKSAFGATRIKRWFGKGWGPS
jgi:sulfide:quinone oxidoreductase